MLRDYIYDTKFQLWVFDDSINILNYLEIISFDDDKIILKYPNGILSINGKDLVITKMLSSELLVNGIIKNIEFR